MERYPVKRRIWVESNIEKRRVRIERDIGERPIYGKILSKETHTGEKWHRKETIENRPHQTHQPTETWICDKRPTYLERNIYIRKETCMHGKRPTHLETDLCIRKKPSEKRSAVIDAEERDLHLWKETYVYGKRPAYTEKDVRVNGKRL